MEIICIFENCLWAIKYTDEGPDEFERLFELWQDIEYLEQFFEDNKQDLQSEFYGEISVEEAVRETRNEAKWLQKTMMELSQLNYRGQIKGLDELFRPLDDNQYRILELSKSKAYGNRYKSWLRIYAIKVDSNVYMVTGGAIKLTHKMKDREHTKNELTKIERCKDYLKELGIFDADSLNEI
jgi:hypothetical protein